MSVERLEIRFLERIDKHVYVPGSEMDAGDIALDRCWDDGIDGSDAWHVRLLSLSRYASMDQVREFILSRLPRADMSGWSFSRAAYGGGATASGMDWRLDITAAELESIETLHSDPGVYERVLFTRDIGLAWQDLEWIRNAVPGGPVDAVLVGKAMAGRKAHYAGLGADGLLDVMSQYEYGNYGDPVQFLEAARAYARKTGTKAWARLSD